ncbi:MAG: SprB repeat-containing protein, partial [Bacteroidia bacterium]
MKKLLLFSLLALFTCFAGAQPISIQLNPSQYSGGYNLSCNGASDGSINLTITGGAAPFTILWDDTITSEDRVNLIAGTYSVIVVDSLSDSATASITLTEPQAISVSLYSPSYNGFNIHCNGGSEGEIVANVSGGVTPYSFLWSNDSITNSINGLAAGVYSVVVSGANGCIDSASKTITEPPLLNTSIASTVNASGYNINCGGKTTGNINLTVNGGASPYTYTWSSGHISEDLSNIGVGNFSVRVDDNNGCSKYDSLVITAPIELSLNITPILYPNGQSFSCVTCNDGKLAVNISGGVSPYTFLWSDTQANDTAVGLSSSAIPYTVTVTDALGCDSTISYLLNLPPPPPSPLFLSGYVSTHAGTGNVSCGICSDGSITLTVSGGIQPYSYNWNTGATTQNITNIDTGYYSVIVIDNAGDTVTQSFNVIYNSPPPPPTANIYLSFMNLDTMAKTVDVWVNNMGGPIGDFGFNLMSGILQQAYGGLAASNGYTVNAGGATAAESIAVLGSRNGGTIPSGNNHLTTLKFTGTMPSSICFMGAGGFKDTLNMPLSVSTGMCINTGVTPPPPPPPTTNVYLSFMNVDTALKTVEVWVNNMGTPIGDFGFNLMSGMLQEATGGLSATNGYTLSASGMTVLGARNGGTIPSGNYHLTTLKFSGSLPYNSICFMGAGGFKDTLNMPLSVSTGMCINTGVTPPPPPPPTTNVYLSFMNVDTALK